MLKQKRNLLACVLIVVLAVSSFTACSSGNAPNSEPSTIAPTDASTTQAAPTKAPEVEKVIDASSIVGKVITGYQGWFGTYGEGSEANQWKHWSDGAHNTDYGKPAPGLLKVEMYPDIFEYSPTSLFATGFANLGDGRPATVFSSYKEDVTDIHFKWMQTYGIDGAALQRFASELVDASFKENRDKVASNVKNAAEKYGRIFYLMYDISGMAPDFDVKIQNDWTNTIVNTLDLTSSPQYAKQDGKTVVCIWGAGFKDRNATAERTIKLVNWFKSQGCYVIGGVPTDWRISGGRDSKPGFEEAYKTYDMIQPWTPGRYKTDEEINTFMKERIIPDLELCKTNNQDYQPVVHPGFAWSNWKADAPVNHRPRRQGDMLWRQIYNIASLKIPSMYLAMFDEYDESTAFMKAAEDSSQIPTDQYFLTMSADGTYISSDFYLRLAGAGSRMIKGKDALTEKVPIPFSLGPVFFRTGFEAGLDAVPTWTSTVESGGTGITGLGGTGSAVCINGSQTAHRRSYSLKIAGNDNSTSESNVTYKVVDVDIPVSNDTKLSYWINPAQDLGRYVSVDLVMTDGTTLSGTEATDYDKVSMKPSAGRGKVNTWTQVKCDAGKWLNGKTIDRILVSYDQPAETGDFSTFIDDIVITTGQLDY